MASRPPTVAIDESEFPPLYHATDRNSLDGQRRFLAAIQLRLAMLVVAALFGLIIWHRGRADLGAVVAGAAFAVALAAELYLLRRRTSKPASPMPSRMSRRAKALPSRRARVMWARVWARVSP